MRKRVVSETVFFIFTTRVRIIMSLWWWMLPTRAWILREQTTRVRVF